MRIIRIIPSIVKISILFIVVVGYFYGMEWNLWHSTYKVVPVAARRKIPVTISITFDTKFKNYIFKDEKKMLYTMRESKVRQMRSARAWFQRRGWGGGKATQHLRRENEPEKKFYKTSVNVAAGEISHKIFLDNLKNVFTKVYFSKKKETRPKSRISLYIPIPEIIETDRVFWDDPISISVIYDFEIRNTSDNTPLLLFSAKGDGAVNLYEHLGMISQNKYYKEALTLALTKAYNNFVLQTQKPEFIEKILFTLPAK